MKLRQIGGEDDVHFQELSSVFDKIYSDDTQICTLTVLPHVQSDPGRH